MPKRLAFGGCMAIAMILAVVMLISPSFHSSYIDNSLARNNPYSVSHRICPSGYYAGFYGTLPLYRGGPAEQFNVKCIQKGQPVYAEHIPFTRNYRAPFDRIRQDPYAMVY